MNAVKINKTENNIIIVEIIIIIITVIIIMLLINITINNSNHSNYNKGSRNGTLNRKTVNKGEDEHMPGSWQVHQR